MLFFLVQRLYFAVLAEVYNLWVLEPILQIIYIFFSKRKTHSLSLSCVTLNVSLFIRVFSLGFRCGQQGAACPVHMWDVGEDVQSRTRGLFCFTVQPLRLLCGVRRNHWNHSGRAGNHVSPWYLCVPLRPPAEDLQGHTVRLLSCCVCASV